MKKKTLLFSLFILFLVACSTQLIKLTQADADRGAAKFEGTTLESLNRGKAIFEANCDKCHGLKKPGSRNEQQWNTIVPQMVKKVNKSNGQEVIDPQKQELLLRYLVTMSSPLKQ
jgi:cytochrome c5